MSDRPVPAQVTPTMARPRRVLLRFVITALVAVLAAATAGLLGSPSSSAAVRTPHVPSGLPSTIEPMADYVGQVSCDPHVRPGTAKLARLLVSTYPSAHSSWSSAYACGTDGSQSEHYEGRAIDWMVDVHHRAQYAAAKAVIGWMLATDRAGNHYAMARRLGVMYIIYNNRIWGSWGGGWQPYNNCSHHRSRGYDNACHRTHVHISLSWNGAMGRTSFWTKHVYATDFGPCRGSGLNWAPRYSHANYRGCPQAPRAKAPKHSSSTKRALVTYSGAYAGPGSTGPVVTSVQRALHVAATGRYGSATVRAVHAFQARHHVAPATGRMSTATWRALLAAVR